MSERARTVRRALGGVSLVLAFEAVPSIVLADITKGQCADANVRGQELRRDGKLAAAREQLLRCADPSCPGIVRDDCTRRLDDVDKAQPTIAFEVKDATGSDVSAVSVTMDGNPWASALEGKALTADPGKHEFVFTVAGRAPVARALVLTEGEKGRREAIVLEGTAPAAPAKGPGPAPAEAPAGSPPPAATSAPAAPPAESASPQGAGMGTQKILGLTAAGAGVVGLGIGTAFGLMTTSAWNSAKSACGGDPSRCTDVAGGESNRNTAQSDATISTVGFVAGGVLLAAGAVLFFTGGSHESNAASGAHAVIAPAVGPGQAGIALRGSF